MFKGLCLNRQATLDAVQKRLFPRRRTRLRPAKLASLTNEYICDCTTRDISAGGLRILLNEDIPLPKEFYVFDVNERTIAEVRLSWRDGLEAGVAYLVPPASISFYENTGVRRLAQRFYAVED
ncbi:PilZ domain-containing protein [Roseibium sp. MMSF_3361]|uniref:PilZ domain-containing protein n=1 Tax=Roseibium sp. MMSF_3361 TaxID=3046708 RepID=UPI0009281647|nr:PilZ domain-containing protein [Roseibium sp. MMSF_3361]OJJ12097.1 pilus assembly protein PilZ [Alphaproteobacteria bacterium AO1-B]